jgi:chloramphenicol O-acetyltransferase
MSNQNYRNYQEIFRIVISTLFISIGIWEAITASKNNLKNNDYNTVMTQAYIFCVIKSIFNIKKYIFYILYSNVCSYYLGKKLKYSVTSSEI